MLAHSIRGYVERIHVGGRGGHDHPRAFKAFAERFKPLVGVPLATADDVLLAADQFLTIVVTCSSTAGEILGEAIQQSIEEQ